MNLYPQGPRFDSGPHFHVRSYLVEMAFWHEKLSSTMVFLAISNFSQVSIDCRAKVVSDYEITGHNLYVWYLSLVMYHDSKVVRWKKYLPVSEVIIVPMSGPIILEYMHNKHQVFAQLYCYYYDGIHVVQAWDKNQACENASL